MLAFVVMSNPLASATSWDLVAKEYAEVTAPFFEHYARIALDRAGVRSGTRVVDIAAGPGTLGRLAARRGCRVMAVDFSPGMIEELRASSAGAGLLIEAQAADGQSLPFADGSYDAAFSMFGLIFFPNRAKGLSEMFRVLVPGGLGVISSWQPVERFPLLGDVFAAIRNLLPNLPFGGGNTVLGTAAEIEDEISRAGFTSVVAEEISASFAAGSLEEAWDFLRRGSAPFALLERTIGDSAWRKLQDDIVMALRTKYGSGPQHLTISANLGIGRKAATT
jgi:SAM-dependent methyltransferase